MNEAEAVFLVGQTWCLIGGVVSFLFLVLGLDRIDSSSHGSYAFRLLLIPGIILLWPIVLWRWFSLERERDRWQDFYAPPRKHHGFAAVLLAILVVLLLLTSWSIRQTWTDYEPERLSALLVHEVFV